MTIPTLMNNTNKQEYVSRLKKVYSTLSQVTGKVVAENGSPVNWATDRVSVADLFKKHLQITKDCGTGEGCFWTGKHKFLNNNDDRSFDSYTNVYKVLLQDSTQIAFAAIHDCQSSVYGMDNVCMTIWADVNGDKGPNQWGRDLFMFVLTKDGFYPTGCDTGSTDCTANGKGYTCTCKVLREGTINY